MSNSRLFLTGLGLVLVLVAGGLAIMSISAKLQAAEPVQSVGATAGANNIGAANVPTTPSSSEVNAVSVPNTAHTADQPPEANSVAGADVKTANDGKDQAIYCPKQAELFKKEMFWYGPNTWRDYSASFVNNINNFAGAQWVGVNVGKIICLYKGLEDNNFPIALERDNLMKKPEGEYWKADPSGYQVCKSDKVSDCPFLPQAVKSEENTYDFLKDIKNK